MNNKFTLETDPSVVGLGAVQMQKKQTIAFISRKLYKREENYLITENEMLASIWATENLIYFLKGKKFILITGHKL